MLKAKEIREALIAALPIIAGYAGIGLPCGIMEQQIGMDAFQAFVVSVLFYSGAGQFMIPGMLFGGASVAAIIASVSAVNTRQILYSASLSKYCQDTGKLLSFLYSGTVTDETFGVNITRFATGGWKVSQAFLVNMFSCASWASANALGVAIGNLISIPVAVGAFAMTSIFICLLFTQKLNRINLVVIVVSALGVCLFKLIGLGGAAIVLGAVLGVGAGLLVFQKRGGLDEC